MAVKKYSPAQKLLQWYDRHKRDLPWRHTSDPYSILVSELMLQQTQVATVIPYYINFLKKFPTAKKLAAASEQLVLRQWEGLGYYRRARFLHGAAAMIAKNGFPKDIEGIRALPGVGEYTAAAVGSIAFGIAHPVVDGNVIRVTSRLEAIEGDPLKFPALEKVKAAAAGLLDAKRAGDSNQAMMELGATICLAAVPLCEECPLAGECKSRKAGRQLDFPQLARRPETVEVTKVAAIIRRGGEVLMGERQGKVWMKGMWAFPEVVTRSKNLAQVAGRVCQSTIGLALKGKPLGLVSHQVTNHKVSVHAFEFGLKKENAGLEKGWRWVKMKDLVKLPLAKAERLLVKKIQV